MLHLRQGDGFLCLSSVSTGSDERSPGLTPLRDANRALTRPAPPTPHPFSGTKDFQMQTSQSCCCSAVRKQSPQLHTHVHVTAIIDANLYSVIHHSRTKQTMHHRRALCSSQMLRKEGDVHTLPEASITHCSLPKHSDQSARLS